MRSTLPGVSDAHEPAAAADGPAEEEEEEVLDAVLVEQPRIVPSPSVAGGALERRASVIPAVQAAAVAAGGFVAGAAVVGLVQHRQRRALSAAKGRRGAGRLGRGASRRAAAGAGEVVQIVGSRSLLVDVHLLGGADGDR